MPSSFDRLRFRRFPLLPTIYLIFFQLKKLKNIFSSLFIIFILVQEGQVLSMVTLPGGRLVCLTEQHALVLLQLNPTYKLTENYVSILSKYYPSAPPTHSYNFVHCLQGAGPIAATVRSHSRGKETITAVRAGPSIIPDQFSSNGNFPLREESLIPDTHLATPNSGSGVVGTAGSPQSTARGAAAEVNVSVREDAELAKESSGDLDGELCGLMASAMETEHGGEELSVGGEATYGAPGALITMYADVVLDKMFDSGPGEAEGTTGLWPLKHCPWDTRHAAVLVSSTNSARVLAIDGKWGLVYFS